MEREGDKQPGVAEPGSTVAPNLNFQSASDLITDKLGLERISGFSALAFFSDIFRKHDRDQTELLFALGTVETTPRLHPSMAVLPSPWIFFRILVATLIVYFVLLFAWEQFGNVHVVPGLIMVGSFAVPLATLILFYEINTPRNVSIVRVLQLVALGGALSILFALFLFSVTPWLGVFGASAAGVVEEVAKLVTVLLVLRTFEMKRYPYLLNALLFGAAVGAGFAAFESAGYALRIGLQFNADAMLDNITLRGVMSPAGHIVWTAIASSAYWLARKSQPDFQSTVTSKKFLALFAVPVVLHFTWNLPFSGPFLVKFWVLGFVAWVVVISLIQSGLKEIAALAEQEQEQAAGIDETARA